MTLGYPTTLSLPLRDSLILAGSTIYLFDFIYAIRKTVFSAVNLLTEPNLERQVSPCEQRCYAHILFFGSTQSTNPTKIPQKLHPKTTTSAKIPQKSTKSIPQTTQNFPNKSPKFTQIPQSPHDIFTDQSLSYARFGGVWGFWVTLGDYEGF